MVDEGSFCGWPCLPKPWTLPDDPVGRSQGRKNTSQTRDSPNADHTVQTPQAGLRAPVVSQGGLLYLQKHRRMQKRRQTRLHSHAQPTPFSGAGSQAALPSFLLPPSQGARYSNQAGGMSVKGRNWIICPSFCYHFPRVAIIDPEMVTVPSLSPDQTPELATGSTQEQGPCTMVTHRDS